MPHPPSVDQPRVAAALLPATDQPLSPEVLHGVTPHRRSTGLTRPCAKRLARLVTGWLASDRATTGQRSTSRARLAITPANAESIARRRHRIRGDPRLDPTLLRPLLPELRRPHLLAPAATVATAAAAHARFPGVTLVLDESSPAEHVPLLVIGIPIGGVVLPLAGPCGQQTVPLPDGEYWPHLTSLLQEVLPAALRDHVLVGADRADGLPRLLALLTALGWNWLLRVHGQTQVRLADGTTRPLRTLVPRPGTHWSGGFRGQGPSPDAASDPVGVFKAAGWRRSHVVAGWAAGHTEPWRLLTSLPASLRRVAEYAHRGAIERLVLRWKSHGWQIEARGIHDPKRLGRLLTGVALATLWRLAMARPVALQHLDALARRVGRSCRPLPLPGFGQPPRPWAAKFSLFTGGAEVARRTPLRTQTPARCCHLPDGEGRTGKEICRLSHHPPTVFRLPLIARGERVRERPLHIGGWSPSVTPCTSGTPPGPPACAGAMVRRALRVSAPPQAGGMKSVASGFAIAPSPVPPTRRRDEEGLSPARRGERGTAGPESQSPPA